MKYISHSILYIAILSCILIIKSSSEPLLLEEFGFILGQFSYGNEIVFNLSCGMLVSIWFYVLVVLLPEYFRRTRIKRNFLSEYRVFRKQLILHVLSNGHEPYFTGLVEELTDVSEFKKYFHTIVDENQNRWYMFSNGLSDKALKEIVLEFEAFKEAIIVLLLNVDIQNDEVVSFLHRFKTISITLKGVSTEDYMGYKVLLRLLWEMLSGFTIDGYKNSDIFEDVFKKI
jgi:hypothetical protein